MNIVKIFKMTTNREKRRDLCEICQKKMRQAGPWLTRREKREGSWLNGGPAFVEKRGKRSSHFYKISLSVTTSLTQPILIDLQSSLNSKNSDLENIF